MTYAKKLNQFPHLTMNVNYFNYFGSVIKNNKTKQWLTSFILIYVCISMYIF